MVSRTDDARDAEKCNIVAFARWMVWREERPREEWDVLREIQIGELGPEGEVNYEAAKALLGGFREQSRKFVGGAKCVCEFFHLS